MNPSISCIKCRKHKSKFHTSHMANCRSVMQIDSLMWFWLPLNHKEALLSCQVLQWLPLDTNGMNQICREWECITKTVLAKTQRTVLVFRVITAFLYWITFSLVNSGTWKIKHLSLGEAWGSNRLFMNCKKNFFFFF